MQAFLLLNELFNPNYSSTILSIHQTEEGARLKLKSYVRKCFKAILKEMVRVNSNKIVALNKVDFNKQVEEVNTLTNLKRLYKEKYKQADLKGFQLKQGEFLTIRAVDMEE
jgi:hypothetical protein